MGNIARAKILLPVQNLGHNGIAGLAIGSLLKLLRRLPPGNRQIGQQLVLFLTVFGLGQLRAFQQLLRLPVVDAGNGAVISPSELPLNL